MFHLLFLAGPTFIPRSTGDILPVRTPTTARAGRPTDAFRHTGNGAYSSESGLARWMPLSPEFDGPVAAGGRADAGRV